MARKVIHVEAKTEMRKRIVRELQIMHDTNSIYIVNFYGAFLSENSDVIMCMEYMDVGLPKSEAFPSILEDMIQKCMSKNPDERPTPAELFEREPFVQAAKRTPVDLKEWAVGMMERDNRKSHLAPQLSPSTQQLLRSSDSPTTTQDSNGDYSLPTPTSGDIPIGGADIRSAITSPQHTKNDGYSPTTKNGSMSLGRAGGAAIHPGLPPRVSTTNSVPRVTTLNGPDHSASNGPSSASAATFSTTIPMRPAPPGGPLPPPPVPKKEGADLDGRKESRRQAHFGNGLYGSNYPAGNGTGPY
ncbi:putative Serine/threonine-protein kinase STE7 like protein [Glarea lozoyensis 74030]|uniref:Putative Serine/threonine-protein kinase STE7 like protein n=1 Tax=Glarea lozoyensis (strain ATCC 74030 / MF5533) TaxID=1104152 RepID=H0EZ88_GLAL7|nr:putative Serine/threonine-protein kinase STE7 like protein [Glarea lozoyensis 74030]